MSADELKSFIKSTMRHAEKEVLEAVLVALKSKRKRRTPEEIAADAAKPKRPISEKQKHWNAFVSQVHAEMKEEDPKAKRTDAMKRAKELKAEGKMPPGPADDDSDIESDSDSESVAPPPKKAPAKAAAPKKEVAKKETPKKEAAKKEKPATKPAKPSKVAPPPESDSDSDDEPPKPAPAKKEPKKSSPKATPPPPPQEDDYESADEDDGEALKPVVIGNKRVLMSSMGECWEQTDSGAMGKWLGLFDAKSKKIKPAPEPELE